MGIGDDLRRLNEAGHRRREKKHMEATTEHAATDLQVQAAILAELQAMNRHLTWLCQAVDERKRERRW
jgi:hypothetical protein